MSNLYKDKPTSGRIASVIGADANGVGTVGSVRYIVRLQSELGSYTIGPVAPSNRRPVDNQNFKIRAAQVGDVVACYWEGNAVKFQIVEGLAPADCSGQPLPLITLPGDLIARINRTRIVPPGEVQ